VRLFAVNRNKPDILFDSDERSADGPSIKGVLNSGIGISSLSNNRMSGLFRLTANSTPAELVRNDVAHDKQAEVRFVRSGPVIQEAFLYHAMIETEFSYANCAMNSA